MVCSRSQNQRGKYWLKHAELRAARQELRKRPKMRFIDKVKEGMKSSPRLWGGAAVGDRCLSPQVCVEVWAVPAPALCWTGSSPASSPSEWMRPCSGSRGRGGGGVSGWVEAGVLSAPGSSCSLAAEAPVVDPLALLVGGWCQVTQERMSLGPILHTRGDPGGVLTGISAVLSAVGSLHEGPLPPFHVP